MLNSYHKTKTFAKALLICSLASPASSAQSKEPIQGLTITQAAIAATVLLPTTVMGYLLYRTQFPRLYDLSKFDFQGNVPVTQKDVDAFKARPRAAQEAELSALKSQLGSLLIKKPDNSIEKLKVLVCGADGGAGHRMAGQAIATALGSDLFDVRYVDVPLPTGAWNAAMKANNGYQLGKMASSKWVMENFMDTPMGRASLSRRLTSAFGSESPDIVIQANHNLTRIIQDWAQERNAQFHLIPTDLQFKPFIYRAKAASLENLSIRYFPGTWDEDSQKYFTTMQLGFYFSGTGEAVRKGFTDFADAVYGSNPQAAKDEVRAVMRGEPIEIAGQKRSLQALELISPTTGFVPFEPEKDDGLFIMLGGAGTSERVILAKLFQIAQNIDVIRGSKKDGKLHIYVAQAYDFGEQLHKFLPRLPNHEKIVLHPLKGVDEYIGARLRYATVGFFKLGGGTAKEILTIGGISVGNMEPGSPTEQIEWERVNALYLQQIGSVLLSKGDDYFVTKLAAAFAQMHKIESMNSEAQARALGPREPNQFYQAYPYVVLKEWIAILKKLHNSMLAVH